MVAVQAFIDRAEQHTAATRRAHLQILPPSERLDIPGEVRTEVDALYDEIDDRVLKPVIEAPTLEVANERAVEGFEVFIDLWPRAIVAFLPWLQGQPNQLGKLAKAGRSLWRSEAAVERLGADACEWFAAAQSARQALADSILDVDLGANLDALMRYTLLADFSLMLGVSLVQAQDTKAAEGLAISIAKWAHTSATNAFAVATTHLYADQVP